MIDYLLNFLPEKSNLLNLFSYLTTRTVLSTLTGLMMVLFLGNTFIERIRSLQFQQSIGDRGPESHKLKDGTPTMGGLLIIGSVILSGFLWGDLTNKYLLISIFCLFMFGLIGFVDDYNKVKQKNQEGMSGKSKIFWQFICACIISVVLYTTAENKMETSYIVPFFKDVVLDFGIWFIFISIL